MPADESPQKGILLRLFAIAVLLVGGLDMMLSWRRGLEAGGFYVAIFATGIVLFAVSWVLQSGKEE